MSTTKTTTVEEPATETTTKTTETHEAPAESGDNEGGDDSAKQPVQK